MDRTWLQLMCYTSSRPQCSNFRVVKCWNSNSMGTRGYVKEGLELTPMSSFVEQGGVNSRPDSRRVLEMGADRWTWLQLVCCAP